MLPSPSMHRSPSLKLAGNHNGRRSFENVRVFKENDEDLTLFNDMSAKEMENFLLPCTDEDISDSITTKFQDLSDVKLGVTIPVRGDCSDLLDQGEKNEYDWLLTPPDTPLFPSLDDESSPPPDLQERGRPRSQPIDISISITMEKCQRRRASRTSASPQRRSPSSKSNTSITSQSRIRPSSAPHSGVAHPLTPQRRPSTPPGKSGNQTPVRRLSTGSSDYRSFSRRGTSPVYADRGISASPKLSCSKTNLTGFSSDPPPNVRTSIADSPSSCMRGSSSTSRNGRERGTSPSSRNGNEASSIYRKRSTSPAISRGNAPLHNHEHHNSPHSKVSVGSSCVDKVESVQSTLPEKYLGTTDELDPKKDKSFSSPKGLSYSKKSSRTISASSVPKRSFDSAMRQMDRHKSPQRMFRPLLSSVPSSSLANSFHQHLAAISSTVTYSSNPNSEWGVSVPDTDGSDHAGGDLVYECEKVPFFVDQKEFSSQKGNETHKDSLSMELHAADLESIEAVSPPNASSDLIDACGESEERVFEKFTSRNVEVDSIYVTNRSVSCADNFANLINCSNCGEEFPKMEIMDENLNVCRNCISKDEYMSSYLQSQPDHDVIGIQANDIILEVIKQNELGLNVEDCCGRCAYPEPADTPDNGYVKLESHEERDISWLPDQVKTLFISAEQNNETNYVTEALQNEYETIDFMQYGPRSDYGSTLDLQVKDVNSYSRSRPEASEGMRNSLLLVRSSSSRKALVHGKTLSTSSISYDSPSYMTNSFNSAKVLSNASCTSSVSTETTSTKETGAHFQCPSSPRKSDFENSRTDIHSDLQKKPLYAGVQSCAFQTEVCVTVADANLQDSVIDADSIELENVLSLHNEKSSILDNVNSERIFFSSLEPSVSAQSEPSVVQVIPMDACHCLPSDNAESIPLVKASDAPLDEIHLVAKHCNLDENEEDCYPNGSEDLLHGDVTIPNKNSSVAMDESIFSDQLDVVDKASKDRLATVSEVQENGQISLTRSDSETAGYQSESIFDQGLSTFCTEDVDATCEVPEKAMLDHSPSSKEERTGKIEDLKRCLSRNTTLEEATEIILFCSSIVHDLAYKAASSAIEKEVPLHIEEDCRPTVTIPARSGPTDSGRPNDISHTKRVPRLRKTSSKEPPKKIDDRTFAKMEMEVFYETKIHHVTEPKQDDSAKPPKLESKCNCSIM